MTNKEYNGWYNYETWVVNLWMDNEEGSQSYWRSQAESYAKNDDTRGLADALESEHQEALPELTGSDLLNGAMSEVNWYEIAEHLIADYKADNPEDFEEEEAEVEEQ